MAFRRARSIDRLHELVVDRELVLTPDPPLALALNRRTSQARLGDLARTPGGFARQGLEVADRRELFHRLVRRTDLSFKAAAAGLDRVLRCWEHTGRADALTDHERLDTPETRRVLEVVRDAETAHSLREARSVPPTVDLAVVDPDRLSALDRRVLPDPAHYETVDPFEDAGRFDPGPLDVLPSAPALARAVEAHLTPDNAGDVGVVLDPAGPVRPLLESALEARGIPYHTEETLGEHPGLRAFLRTLRLGLTRRGLRGREVRGLLAELGATPDPRDEERRLAHVDEPRLDELEALWDRLPGASVNEVLDAFQALAPRVPRELPELVDDLELGPEPVTADLVNALAFYLDTYRVERDHEREGALLASGRENAYVDRPLVIHLGLGANWAQPTPADPWIGPDERARLHANDRSRFERLLQSGRSRALLVQDTRRGRPVTPCVHLQELWDDPIERFAEAPSRRRRPPEVGPRGRGFEPDPDLVHPDAEPPDTLAAGDLDALTDCPRDWFMDQLVPQPPRPHLRRGRLLHALAELLVARPELVDVRDPDQRRRLVEIALAELADLVPPDERPPLATDLAIGFQAVARWLTAHPPAGEVPDAYRRPPPRRRTRNPFAEALDVDLDPERAERWFEDAELGVHGQVDLVHAPDRLVDWKSTRSPDSLPRTLRRTRVDGDEARSSLQPGVYLLHHRRLRPEAPLELVLVDLLGNRRDAVGGRSAPGEASRRVAYHPRPFPEHAASREVFENVVKTSKRRRDVFEAVGYPAYRDYVQRNGPPPTGDRARAAASPFADGLAELAERHRGAPATSEKAARGAAKRLADLRARTLYPPDLDRLAAHVQATLASLGTWYATRFPVPDDADLDEVRHRELILRDVTTHRRGEPPG